MYTDKIPDGRPPIFVRAKFNQITMTVKNNPKDEETSLFKGYKDVRPAATTWQEVYRLITSGTLKDETEKYRFALSQGFKKEAERIKSGSFGVTTAVICRGGRTLKDIIGYTGYCHADFDHLPTEELPQCMQRLASDPYVFLAYITISNRGIRVIFKIDGTGKQYKQAFLQGNRYFQNLIGHEFDPACKNDARLCGLCHDPQAIYRPEAEVLHTDLLQEVKKAVGRPKRTYHATASQAEPAILSELAREGKEYLPAHHNEYISSALYKMNRVGVPRQEALEWALERFSDYGPANVENICESVYRNMAEHGTQRLSVPGSARPGYASVKELETFIATQADIRYNEILGRREIRWKEETDFHDLTDNNENSLWTRAKKAGLDSGLGTFLSILNSEFIPVFNPFAEYFSSLPQWDGQTDYIARLADTVKTATPLLFRKYLRMWLVGMVASITDEHTVNQSVLTLIGAQGKYKTTWLHRLLPPTLRRYFYTKANSSRLNKDDLFTLAEYALVCYEELDDMSSADLNQLKALITMPYVNERAAYARNRSYRPHIASLCATGNNLHFLKDRSGYRRWFVFEVLSILDPYCHKVDYDHVYSQALALYRSRFRFWVTEKEIRELNLHNEQFEIPDLERELIQLYYRKPQKGEKGVLISNSEILQKISLGLKNPISTVNIGISMKKLGFNALKRNNIRGYSVIERTAQEIIDRKKDSTSEI